MICLCRRSTTTTPDLWESICNTHIRTQAVYTHALHGSPEAGSQSNIPWMTHRQPPHSLVTSLITFLRSTNWICEWAWYDLTAACIIRPRIWAAACSSGNTGHVSSYGMKEKSPNVWNGVIEQAFKWAAAKLWGTIVRVWFISVLLPCNCDIFSELQLTLFLILFLIVSMTPALSLSHSFSVVLRSSQAICIFSSSNVIMAFCNARQQNVLFKSRVALHYYLNIKLSLFYRSDLCLNWQKKCLIKGKECYVRALKRTKGSFCITMNGGTQGHLYSYVISAGVIKHG